MPREIGPPIRTPTRSAISWEALLVNVIARICPGATSHSRIRYAIRWVRARVLPEPAPATIRMGPSVWRTAWRWMSFRPSRRGEVTLTGRMLARGRDPTPERSSDLDVRQMADRGTRGTVVRMSVGTVVRRTIRAFGFACLMLGSGLAGYVGWLLWGTGLETARAQDELRISVERGWGDHPTPAPSNGRE